MDSHTPRAPSAIRAPFTDSLRPTMARVASRRILPFVLALALLIGVGFWVRGRVQASLEHQLEDQLTAIIRADNAALRIWLNLKRQAAAAIADSPAVRRAAVRLISSTDSGDRADNLRKELAPRLMAHRFNDWILFDVDKQPVTARFESHILTAAGLSKRSDFVTRALAGEVIASRPFSARAPNEIGELADEIPTMFFAAPVKSAGGDVVGVLAFRVAPQATFTKILRVAQSGASGETYAFDRDGLLLSASRFDEQLRSVGLIEPSQEAILRLQIRDPGGDLTQGFRPIDDGKPLALTHAVAAAIEGGLGVTSTPYRDYRGVAVIGAWIWLDEFDFGMVTEIDAEEAFESADVVRQAVLILIALLILSGGVVVVVGIRAERTRSSLDRAMEEVRRLGKYTLVEKIGQGGMGQVFRATHATLRRPTAVKTLRVDTGRPELAARFEREAQATAALVSPHTVSLYDFGRADDGTFYYVMELLDGLDLETIVAKHGASPPERVVSWLLQALHSLGEAHARGLIHRDIKPANLFAARYGQDVDFIKVLDFGLVKDVLADNATKLTIQDAPSGTAHYMPPEQVLGRADIDGRADLYSLGAVAHYLLTGRDVFEGTVHTQLLFAHVNQTPTWVDCPEADDVPDALKAIILRCMAKSPDDRYATARDLADALRALELHRAWTEERAHEWWALHYPRRGSLARQ